MLRLQHIYSLQSVTMQVKVNTHLIKLIYIAALDELIYADLLDSDDLIIDKILCNDNPYLIVFEHLGYFLNSYNFVAESLLPDMWCLGL